MALVQLAVEQLHATHMLGEGGVLRQRQNAGTIEAIGEKTVLIRNGGNVKRLDLAEFTELNWNYSERRIAKNNSEWMD